MNKMALLNKQSIARIFLEPKELFFSNIGLKQTIIKNTAWLAIAEGISKLLKLFLFIYIARILGAAEYGKFSFALAFVSLFIIFSHLGVFKILTREFSKHPEKEKDFPALVALKFFLSLLSFCLIFIGSFLITGDSLIRTIILILGIEVLLNSFLIFIFAFFRARQKMELQAAGQILQVVLVTGLCFLVLFNIPSALNLSWAYLIGTLAGLIAILIFFHYWIFPLKLKLNFPVWKNYLVMSYPLALIAVLGTIHSNIDSTIMGALGEITAVGWYNAGQKIVQASFVITGLIGMSFFPVLSRLYVAAKEKFDKVIQSFMEIVVFLTAPIVVGGIFLAPKIIDLVYDPSYLPAVFAFQILLLAFGISTLTAPFNQSLIIANQQKKIFWVVLFGTAVNVSLNLILIPLFSLYGACLATLIALVSTLVLNIKLSIKYTQTRFFNRNLLKKILIIGLSSLIMYLVLSWSALANLYVVWLVLIGALIYLFIFWLFKNILKYVKLSA